MSLCVKIALQYVYFSFTKRGKNKKMSLETKHGTKKVEQIREQQSYCNFNEKEDFKKILPLTLLK